MSVAAALATAGLTAGCAHNDVLVFGTSTTLGLNVQTASAGVGPSVVVGYERQEAVWMPLVLNGQDSDLNLCAADADNRCTTGAVPVSQAMYRSTITTGEGATQTVQADAYSVFASLGATFNGRGNSTEGAAAGGGLAQFFATGNAAINVSRNAALVTALKVESSAGAEAQAEAVQAAALSTEQLAALKRIRDRRISDLAIIKACVASEQATWRSLVTAADLAGQEGLLLPTDPDDIAVQEIESRLDGFDEGITALAAKAAQLCPTGGPQ